MCGSEPLSESESRAADFKVVVVCRVIFGLSHKIALYFPMHPAVSHYLLSLLTGLGSIVGHKQNRLL